MTGRHANVGRLLTEAARRYPGRVAVRQDDRALTYGELDARVNALASSLTGLGLSTGDRVVLWLQNCAEFLEAMFACWKLGLAVVPVNARLTGEDVAFHVADSGARALFYGAEFEADAKGFPVANRISVGGEGDIRYEDLVSAAGTVPEQVREFSEETPAWLFYTSGTTGRPKGAVITHRNLMFVTVSWCADVYSVQPEDVVLHCAPLSHGAGFQALVALARGAENIVHARYSPAQLCADIERSRVTVTWLVPTQIRMLLDDPVSAGADLSSLKCLVYGGSPVHLADLKEALDRMGPVLCQLYAQGETPMTLAYLRPEDHRDPAVLTSAGVVRTGMEVRIADEEGHPVAPGVVGEILARGPAVMTGYWERPEATAEALRDGWLHTGDLGRLDERGYLSVLDRMKDFIISGGSNVYAREVEDVLLRHPRIHEAAVFGVPHPVWGEAVTAAVVGEGVAPGDVDEFCRGTLAGYRRPKQIHVCPELPKNAYGKVLKRELRERYSG
jgi:long-chain acyl-CoA synthetase